MSEHDTSKGDAPQAGADHEPPPGSQTTATWSAAGRTIDYTATAGWTVLRTRERPVAEIFSVSYVGDGDGDGERPLTFVFNGGPGASSAFLHMGAVGPTRVAFGDDGTLPPMPPRLVTNEESWLAFTDVVFVDPVGTGFSRVIERDGESRDAAAKGDGEPSREFFAPERDLDSLCEFMSRWLSANGRWSSSVFIAGESYGGYRVGRLVRRLQESAGIGLNGAVLISPALEFATLAPSDYDLLGWVDLVPTMALAAAHHRRSRAFTADVPAQDVRLEAERFATGEYASFLARGASMDVAERDAVLTRLADLIGLPVGLVTRSEGRISASLFTRELMRDERRVLGKYDATMSTSDPFPDREPFAGPDPTLVGISPAYTMAVNHQLRSVIGVHSDREYQLLSNEVNSAWHDDQPLDFLTGSAGATDDFRYGMALNPHMRAFITHGRFDLVTPYYATDRLRNLMRLDPEMGDRLTVQHFGGGHMFYSWADSRREFAAAIAAFFQSALA